MLDTYGCYSILKGDTGAPIELGTGGLGGVYKAFSSDLRCYVALRIIPRDALPSKELHEQFVDEARVAARIRHRGFASVFPLGISGDTYLYATEFCDGETVAARVARDGSLPTSVALNVVSEIAAALDAASAAGLLHRNLLAKNIMLMEEDEGISAKVLDLALPRGSAAQNNLVPSHSCDFSSPEETAGKEIDARSNIYSLGALLCCMAAGFERYELLRTRSLAKQDGLFDNLDDLAPGVALILRRTLCYDPESRVQTFAEVNDLLDKVLHAPAEFEFEQPPEFVPTTSAVITEPPPAPEPQREPDVPKSAPMIEVEAQSPILEAGALMIPAKLLEAAQAGTVLRLKPVGAEMGPPVMAIARDDFRIGRSAASADLVVRFFPRSKVNDTKTRRLSKIHVTAKCENDQVVFLDGDGVRASANGSTFNQQALSVDSPLVLAEPGELRLADDYSIRVTPLFANKGDIPAVANLGDWKGPIDESASSVGGAVLFAPGIPCETGVALWIFSVGWFGSSSAAAFDFGLSPSDEVIGGLRYYCGCFWIESKSANSLLVDDVVLAPGEIAPLVTRQIVEVNGGKYSIEIEGSSANPTR